MIWLAVAVGTLLVAAVAVFAVGRVSAELEGTVAPALLEIADAVEAVGDSLPFEVSAVVSHEDVDTVIRWVLAWFEQLGLSSDFGEELGGDWVLEDRVVADEVGAADFAVRQAVASGSSLDPVHVTVIVDSFITYLRDIGAVGDEVL
ncbi:MAG: hypothetical protein R8J94_12115 [Acidimicrobiia bacterium]|nr:hypothetical protein [Acidimicrobiia bacterium]